MNLTKQINHVIEAATIRRDQWDGIASGRTLLDITEELAEADAEEAAALARGLSDALDLVNGARLMSADQALTALCIWEAAMEGGPALRQWLADGEGACAGRDGCLQCAPFFDEVWQRASARGWDGCFDWDLVPWLLNYAYERYTSPDELTEASDKAAQKAANIFLEEQPDV